MNTTLLAGLALCASPALAVAGDELLKLVPNDLGAGDDFGYAVAISGTTVLVGAYDNATNGLQTGAAYLFDALTGLQTARLEPHNGVPGDRFGFAVDLDGDLAIVGSRVHISQLGSAYLFDVATGAETFELTVLGGTAGDFFGRSVAVAGTTAVVGAPYDDSLADQSGAAYVFDTTTGQQTAKLTALDGTTYDSFGWAVAIHGTTALIGAPGDFHAGGDCGSAYLFDTVSGQQIRKLVPNDGGCTQMFGRQFGNAVDLTDTTAVIGAVYDDSLGPQTGAAYLFDVATGQELAKLVPDDLGTVSAHVGISVAISGHTAIVGTQDGDASGTYGSAYLYDARTGEEIARLTPSDAAPNNDFGFAVDLSGSLAVIGSHLDSWIVPGGGAAYLFDASQAISVPYCFGDGGGTACPCSNPGAAGRGCANSVNASGARLESTGSPCVSDDDLALQVTGSRPSQPGIFFQGDNAIGGGAGLPFGDGLRCAGGNVLRLEAASADASGAVASTVPLSATGGLMAGDVKRYQWWYRDPGASPCGSAVNLSNGLEVVWGS